MQGRAVIIVAGGTGTRMNSPTPKQFLPLSGKPVLMHTFEAFHRFDPDMEFVLVLFKGLEDSWKGLIEKHGFTMSHTVVTGGRERFHSVKNGLDALSPDVKLVGIHDAVRPMVSQGTIARCFEAAAAHGAAIPAVHVVDTIRMVQGFASHTLPRKELMGRADPAMFPKGNNRRCLPNGISRIFYRRCFGGRTWQPTYKIGRRQPHQYQNHHRRRYGGGGGVYEVGVETLLNVSIHPKNGIKQF